MSNRRRLITLLLAGVACASLFSHVSRAQTGAAGGSGFTTLLVDGEVWTAGDHYYGQLGVGGSFGQAARFYRTKVVPFGAAAVAAGAQHSLAMMADGSMYGWGQGSYGQLGVTPSNNHTSPVAVPLSGITAISANGNKSYAVGPGGVVYMFGMGLLGDGTSHKYVYTPTQVPGITGVTAVAAGGDHVLLLKSDGTVLSWGANNAGQVGDGTTTTRLTPQLVPGLTDIVQIGAGAGHSVALTSTGQVYAWGGNSVGSVGDGTQTNRLSPVLLTGFSSLTITQISVGSYHTLARASDGTVHAWGSNGAGQIGDGSVSSVRLSPTFITALSNVITKVVATSETSFAFAADGRVWGWGSNGYGQLGNGTNAFQNSPTLLAEAGGTGGNWIVGIPLFSGSYPNTYYTPQTVTIATGTPGATVRYTTNGNVPTESDAVVPGGGVYIDQSMTIKARAFKTGSPASPVASGTWLLKVNAVGAAPYGTTYTSAVNVTLSTSSPGAELRYTLDGTEPSQASPLYSTPLPIATRTTVKVKGFRAGWDPSQTTTHDYSFNYGKLASPTLSPGGGTYDTDQTITMTAGLPAAQIRYTTDGGDPYSGSPLYAGSIVRSATTTVKARAFHVDWVTSDAATAIYTLQVGTPTLSLPSGAYTPGQTVTISTSTPGATLRFTTTGATPTVNDAIVPATGVILGNFTLKVAGFKTGYNTSPVVTANYALTGDLTARNIAARYYSSFTLSKDGLLSAFGYNGSGHLGDNTTTQRTVPGRVQGITGVVDVSAGAFHTLAVTHSGQVYAWGDNGSGRLGDNSNTQRKLPVLVGGLPPVTRVAAGNYHSLAVTAAGQVYAWGNNANGRLGDGTLTDRWVATLVPGLSNVVGVAAGDSHSLAWTSTGTVWAWGANNAGQLGDGSNTQRTSPVQIATLSNVTQLVAGNSHSMALTSTGAVYAWGDNSQGQLGDNTLGQKTSPVLISALSNITALGAGAMHSLAVTSTGAVYAWGYNANYQLGDGTQTRRTSPVLLAGISNAARVTGGQNHSLALDNNGEVWSWGQGPYGALGNGFSNADPGATVTTPALLNPGAVPAPSVSPTAGTYLSAQNVTLTASTGIIRYTLDGSEPNASSAIYTTPLFVGVTTTVKAKAFQNDWTPSPTTTAVYTIQEAATPVIVPPTGTYQSAQTVTITTSTSGASIRYTLDGSEPSITSTEYSAAFEVSASTTVKAKAFKSGFGDSPTATSVITLNYGELATPTVSPAAGNYSTPVDVTLSGPAGATLRYTIDGSEPTQSAPQYTTPLTIATTTTLRARAYRTDWTPSQLLSATYTIGAVHTPTAVNDTATTTEDTGVSINVLANDVDNQGHTITLVSATHGTRGRTAIASGGTVNYTPSLNANGLDTFTYVINDGLGNTAQASVSVNITPVNDSPTVTLTATPATGAPPLAVQLQATAIDPENDALTYAWTFGDGQTATGGLMQSHTYTTAGVYTARVTVSDGATRPSISGAAVVTAATPGSGEPLPTDPATVAPPNPSTVTTNFSTSTAFLYTGADPIQRGLVPGTLDPARVAVLRGKILNEAGAPLAGARISIPAQTDYGHTLSRSDGIFDIAVNGGGPVVVQIEKAGYLTAQRQVIAPWKDFAWSEDVQMVPVDPVSTTVQFSASPTAQIATGSTVSDNNGARTAAIIVPEGGVHANLHMPDGSVLVDQAQLTLRATEYTVGPAGTRLMPGQLPASSGYTYAVELSADEAMAGGATMVTFDPALAFYVENFLGFPVGTVVPAGYYDRQRSAWVAGPNGRVIKIVGQDGSGRAELDLTGTGTAADAAALAALGVTDGERVQLSARYAAGQSLWRVPIEHFTPWDFNWPYVPPPGVEEPDTEDPDDDKQDDDPCFGIGSIIECQNQALGENMPIAGTPFSLSYRSSRQPGRTAGVGLNLSRASIPETVARIETDVLVAGQRIRNSYVPGPNLNAVVPWDGRDAYGRKAYGAQRAKIQIRYVYPARYAFAPEDFERAFGQPGQGVLNFDRSGLEINLSRDYEVDLTANHVESGLGGWTLDAHHVFDPKADTTYLGSGERIRGAMGGFRVERAAANATVVAPDAAGALVSTTTGYARLTADGDLQPVTLDTPTHPACSGNIDQGDLVPGPDGALYYSTRNAHANGEFYSSIACVSRVKADGTAEHLDSVTYPEGGYTAWPTRLAVAADGTIYLAARYYVFKKTPGDTQYRVIFDGAGEAITGLAVAADGTLYIAAWFTDGAFGGTAGHIFKLTPAGQTIRIAGVASRPGSAPDGGPAIDAYVQPVSLALRSDGTIVFLNPDLDGPESSIREITPDGRIRTIAGGTATSAPFEDGMPALKTSFRFNHDSSLVLMADGRALIDSPDEPGYRSVYQLAASNTATGPGGAFLVPSEDATEVFEFDLNGQHLRTRDGLTGMTLLSFEYDTAGRLSGVLDRDGLRTTIERDGSGQPTGLLAPFGQRTTLSFDANGFLNGVIDPLSRATSFTYTPGGLMTGLTEPGSASHVFTYDAMGRLEGDTHPSGGNQGLTRSRIPDGWLSTVSHNAGYASTYRTERLPDGAERSTVTTADGGATVTTKRPDGTVERVDPLGMQSVSVAGMDPRFGMQVPLTTSRTLTTPGQLSMQATQVETVTMSNSSDPFSVQTKTSTTTVNGLSSTTVYNAAARSVTMTSPTGRQTTTTFDVKGRPIQMQTGSLLPVNISYDSTTGRMLSITQGARSATYAYDANGHVETATTSINASDNLVHGFTHDVLGRMTSQTLPGGRTLTFGYDNDDNLTSVQPPGKPAHLFTFNSFGVPETYTAPGTSARTTGLRIDRQLQTVAYPGGRTLTFGYDSARGVLTSLSDGTTTVGYTTSPSGQLTSVSAPDATVSFGYDGALKQQETWSGTVNGSVQQQYDNNLRPISQSVNGGSSISYGYDNDGLLTSAGALTLTRDSQLGLITGSTIGATTEERTIDGAYGEISGRVFKVLGVPFYASSYTRDRLGRIVTKSEQLYGDGFTEQYVYDAAGRLTEVVRDGLTIAVYTYDDNGNRLTVTDDEGTVTSTYDDADRMLTNGTATFTYVAGGEIKTKTVPSEGTTTYTYDGFGSLRSVALPSGHAITYSVDGYGRRIARFVNGTRTHAWMYDGNLRPIAELDGTGAVGTRFVYGIGVNVPTYMVRTINGASFTYRFVTDLNGSVRAVVDASTGVVAQRIDYDPWGVVLADTNPGFQPFGYAGGLYDHVTGLVRFGAREYDASLGRWMAPDPSDFHNGETNLWAYVGNDPVNRVDPTGLASFDENLAIAANFSAGLGDHITFGLTNRLRDLLDINQGIDMCGASYTMGMAVGVGADLATAGSSLALKGLAKGVTKSAKAAMRRRARQVAGLVKGNKKQAHHVLPLSGHPGKLGPTVFPSQGLPEWLVNHPSNIKALEYAEHMAAHERIAAAERFAAKMGFFDPYLAIVRGKLSSCRQDAGCDAY